MLYGQKIKNSDEEIFGGSDWVQCITLILLTVSSIITLILIVMLLSFQIQVHGFNKECFMKTKSIAICLTLAFNVCLIADLLVYDFEYWWMTIIDLLEFSFKYMAIIALSHFFISRSGDIVAKGDIKKVKNLFRAEVIGASFMLFSILVTKIYIFIDAEKFMDKSSD